MDKTTEPLFDKKLGYDISCCYCLYRNINCKDKDCSEGLKEWTESKK